MAEMRPQLRAQLRLSDVRAGLNLLHALGEAAEDPEQFGRRGVELLPKLVASEITTLSVCDVATGHRRVIGTERIGLDAADRAAFDRHFETHPLVRFHAYDGGRVTRRISDSIPFRQFRETALYDEYYRRIGIDHAVALPLYVNDRWLVSFVLNRARRDFSERDCAVLDLLRDGLAALYRGTQLAASARSTLAELHDTLDAAGSGVAHVDARGKLLDATPRASSQLQRYCGWAPRRDEALPEPIAGWLQRSRSDALSGAVAPLALRAGQRSLTVHALPVPGAGGRACLLLRENVGASAKPDTSDLPLTDRERDVMHWLAAGKTDRDIGEILGISVRTVHKHLQRIYAKLGVETRTAAVIRVLQAREEF